MVQRDSCLSGAEILVSVLQRLLSQWCKDSCLGVADSCLSVKDSCLNSAETLISLVQGFSLNGVKTLASVVRTAFLSLLK